MEEATAEEQARVRRRFQEKAERDRRALLNDARLDGFVNGFIQGFAESIAELVTKGNPEKKWEVVEKVQGLLSNETVALRSGLDVDTVAYYRTSKVLI